MHIKLISLSVASALILGACGSSTGTSSSNQTGILSDSYVKGVAYATSSNLGGTVNLFSISG